MIRLGFFLGAVLLHLVVFLLVASLIVWKAPEPKSDGAFKPFSVKIPPLAPPPPEEPSAGNAAVNPTLEPDQVVVPVVTPQSVISTAKSAFTIDANAEIHQTLSHAQELVARGTGMSIGSGETVTGAGRGLFGSFSGDASLLQGTVYDLKIDPQHATTGMDESRYSALLKNFVEHGWDASLLAPYFKASKTLYTSAIWIPTTASPDTAKAMNLSDELTPNFWVGWYHAKVTPAQSGSYHFVGFGDDILVVAVNGKTVFDGSIKPIRSAPRKIPWSYADWSKSNTYRDQDYAKLRVGDSFEVNGVESVTVDILMGDEPGWFYNAYLLIADDSKQYPVGPEGVPLYPIFQLGSDPVNRAGDQPPHSPTPESWSSP